jgi:hypothetical protein
VYAPSAVSIAASWRLRKKLLNNPLAEEERIREVALFLVYTKHAARAVCGVGGCVLHSRKYKAA